MQQAFISPASSGTTILRLTKKQNACWDTALAAASPVDIPTGWEPRTKQQQWVAFADFPQCSVCSKISENGDIWPNQKRYWSDTSQTMRAKGYWNNWSRSLPGPYPYADKFFAEVQHFLRYGISQGKEQPIFDRHANLKYKYGNRHFWARGYFVDAKESRLCKRWCRKCAVAFLYKKERQILRFDVQYLVHLQGLEPWAHWLREQAAGSSQFMEVSSYRYF